MMTTNGFSTKAEANGENKKQARKVIRKLHLFIILTFNIKTPSLLGLIHDILNGFYLTPANVFHKEDSSSLDNNMREII